MKYSDKFEVESKYFKIFYMILFGSVFFNSSCYLNSKIFSLSQIDNSSNNGSPSTGEEPFLKPNLSFSRFSEVADENQGTLLIKIILSHDYKIPVSINLLFSGNAVENIDYTVLSKIVTFQSGETEKLYPIEIIHNSTAQVNREILISFDPSSEFIKASSSKNKTKIIINDIDGAIKNIFRSVGPTRTLSLEEGNANKVVNLKKSIATFSDQVSLDVGVGDVLVYDRDFDGIFESIAFIQQRLSENEFFIQNNVGLPLNENLNSLSSWKIFRAYTSWYDAQLGIENSGILSGDVCSPNCATLQNFDNRNGGDNLVAQNATFNFSMYADGIDNAPVDVSGWTTDQDHYLVFFTPTELYQVGRSQRHKGKWGSGGYEITNTINPGSQWTIDLNSNNVKIEGLKIGIGLDAGLWGIRIGGGSGQVYLDSNIITQTAGTFLNGGSVAVYVNSGCISGFQSFFSNNLIYGLDDLSHKSSPLRINCDSTLYNNTIVSFGVPIFYGPTSAFNNIFYNVSNDYGFECYGALSANYNSFSGNTYFPQPNDMINAVVSFTDFANKDFNLSPIDVGATKNGLDLTSDPILPVRLDILGRERKGVFDIGAFSSN